MPQARFYPTIILFEQEETLRAADRTAWNWKLIDSDWPSSYFTFYNKINMTWDAYSSKKLQASTLLSVVRIVSFPPCWCYSYWEVKSTKSAFLSDGVPWFLQIHHGFHYECQYKLHKLNVLCNGRSAGSKVKHKIHTRFVITSWLAGRTVTEGYGHWRNNCWQRKLSIQGKMTLRPPQIPPRLHGTELERPWWEAGAQLPELSLYFTWKGEEISERQYKGGQTGQVNKTGRIPKCGVC
jgi:hypothetical protein